MGENQVIHGMQRVIRANAERRFLELIFRCLIRSVVAFCHFGPEPEASEDMGRHMEGMWHRRRDSDVPPCSRQALFCQLCIIVGMNQVMRDTGVIRIPCKQRFEDACRLLLVGERFITGRCRSIETIAREICASESLG